jgi:hypothetical protein
MFSLRILLTMLVAIAPAAAGVRVTANPDVTPRERLAIERLQQTIDALSSLPPGTRVVVGTVGSTILRDFQVPALPANSSETFRLLRKGDSWLVAGSDPSGVLYGCLELARRIRTSGALPLSLDVVDQPQFVLRGTNIGMQKTEVIYDGAVYDYRYTPEEFPFFYDKQHWTRYLDFLLENRMNTLYLWNGHPFTSLLKLPKYPEAQELTDRQLDQNIEMFHWVTAEADRRGIWVIQMFYNVHISHSLAKARGLPYHHTTPTEFTSQYTRYCVSEFIRNYPNVGLMMTLGEALAPRYGPEWLSKTIIPGVKDAMKALGTTVEPPIIVRAHATEIEEAMHQALPLYKNIYTMHKWNGESLTWTDVRGEVLRLHKSLVELGSTHISNVHLLANLEPFRWGSPEFIQKTMQSSQRIGIKGLHVYPLRYWDWPVTADNPSELQIDRDWIWFEAWGRYSWNPNRDPAAEREYWISRIAEKYGTRQAAAEILDAYQLSGVCAPRLLPRIGITEGNRQAFSLGMLMTQFLNPERYNALTLLWTGDAPPGERLQETVERDWKKQAHEGETPLGVAAEVVAAAERALHEAEAAGPNVTRNREEYSRFVDDMRAISLLMRCYNAKVNAAALVLRYGYSRDTSDLRRALHLLEESVELYRKLVDLTNRTYREACSVHSASRRIPFLGGPGQYTHWRDVLPAYEKELATFRWNVSALESSGKLPAPEGERGPFPAVPVKVLGTQGAAFEVRSGARIYSDQNSQMDQIAPELLGLTGIRISNAQATRAGVHVEFELPEPAQVLVGFFRSEKKGAAAAPPKDEWEPILRNAVVVKDHPRLTVWSHALPAGRNEIDFGQGAFVVLGFISKNAQPQPRMVFFPNDLQSGRPDLDWLFE